MIKKIIFFIISIVFLEANAKIKSVSLQLNWKFQFEFAGYIMAKEKGFYKKAGFDVELKEYKKGLDIVDEVLKGNSTFGVGYPTLIYDRANGKKIVLLASIFQFSPLVLISLKSSGIKSVKDFKGKKVMMNKEAAYSVSFLSMFLANDVKLDEMKIIPPSFNINDLIEKKVDVMSAYTSDEVYDLKRLGIDYDVWDPKDYGFDFYDGILFASEKELDADPKVVNAFTNASLKGWRYAFSHIDETIDVILKKYNTQKKSKKALLYEAITLKNLAYLNGIKLGNIDKNKIQRIYDIYKFIKAIKKKIDLDRFIFQANSKEKLKNIEKEYIKEHPIVKICTNPNWKPIEFVDNAKPKGISIDILNILFNNLGFSYRYVKTNSWKESQKFLKLRKCDILPSAVKTKKREKYASFTEPYLIYDLVIVTKKDKPLVQDIKSIINKTMSRKKGSALIEKMKSKYPNLKIIQTKGYKEAFELVSNGDAYFTIATLPVLSYYKKIYGFEDLQIAGYMHKKYKLSIAVRNDKPILLDILSKGLKELPKGLDNIVFQKWATKNVESVKDYRRAWEVLGLMFIVVLVLLYLNYMSKRYTNKLEAEIQKVKNELNAQHKQLLQQSRLAQMGEMISMIAHQWRQPLAAISSTSSALELKAKLGKLDKEQTIKLSKNISKYAQHLSSTIDDFRNFFKTNKKRSKTNFQKLIDSVLLIVLPSIKSDDIELVLKLDCVDEFEAYENELKQVILNLVKNAEDILVEKGIPKPVILIKTYKQGSKLILEVIDNAGGIPKDIIDKIFDPYFSTKTKKDGTGLGLYMSKTIIEDHCGGTLEAENTDKGALFRVTLEGEQFEQ